MQVTVVFKTGYPCFQIQEMLCRFLFCLGILLVQCDFTCQGEMVRPSWILMIDPFTTWHLPPNLSITHPPCRVSAIEDIVNPDAKLDFCHFSLLD